MTEDRMALIELIEKGADGDLVQGMLAFAAEVKRRSDVVGIFPNDKAVVRLVGSLMREQNDMWAVCRRYMTLEGLKPVSDDPLIKLPAVAA